MITEKSKAKHNEGVTYRPSRLVAYKPYNWNKENANEWQSIKNTEIWCFNDHHCLCTMNVRDVSAIERTYPEILWRVKRQITTDVSKINVGSYLPVDAAWHHKRVNIQQGRLQCGHVNNKHKIVSVWPEDIWGSRCIAPLVPNFRARWKWIVSFTSRPLYYRGNNPCYRLNRRLNVSKRLSGRLGEEINLLPLPEIESRIVQPVALTLYLLRYPGSNVNSQPV